MQSETSYPDYMQPLMHVQLLEIKAQHTVDMAAAVRSVATESARADRGETLAAEQTELRAHDAKMHTTALERHQRHYLRFKLGCCSDSTKLRPA